LLNFLFNYAIINLKLFIEAKSFKNNLELVSYTIAEIRLNIFFEFMNYKSIDRSYGAINLILNNTGQANQSLFDLRPYFLTIKALNNTFMPYFYTYYKGKCDSFNF
jgi:hypothetical protein